MWLAIIIIIILILGKVFDSNYAKIKGRLGEERTKKQLKKLSQENYRILNDVMVRAEKGTSQIDHVVISPYGIFVIETKNYRGWIYGKEHSDYWIQNIYGNKIRFRNPIKQNWGHIYALKEVLPQYNNISFHSIIVFSGSAILKRIESRTKVIYDDMIYETIMNMRGIRQLEEEDMDNIYKMLQEALIEDKKAKKEHLENVKTNIKAVREKERGLICPRCNSNLVMRSGDYGEFWGCSNYPKCRYTLRSNHID